MNLRTRASLLTAVLLLPGLAAAQIETGHFCSDAEMLAVLSDTLFVAEGRIGDRGGAATFELDLGQSTAAPNTMAQYPWQSGVPEAFSLSYEPVTSTVSFALGGQVLTYVTDFSEFGVMFVRTRAVNDASSLVVTDFLLDGQPLGDASDTAGPDGLDILWVQGQNLSLGFTLTGTATLAWSDPAPTQSRLAFQIKVARQNVIETKPGSWGSIKDIYRRSAVR
jgi:hypothetical protein